MSLLNLDQLTRAEELFDAGNLVEALEILNDQCHFEGLDLQQRSYFQFLKGLILIYLIKGEDLINLGEEVYEEGQKHNKNLQTFDGLFFIITGLALTGKFEEAFKLFEKADLLLKDISSVSKEIFTQRKLRLSMIKAFTGLYSDTADLVEKSIQWILDSQEEFDNSFEIVWINITLADYLLRVKSNFNLSMEHIKKALSIAKKIKFNHHWIALCEAHFGINYGTIGEFDKALKHYMKCLKLFKKSKQNFHIAQILNNIGIIYGEMGEYELAVKHLEESIQFHKQIPHSFFDIDVSIDSLTTLAFEHEDYERAQKYFYQLEDIYKNTKDDRIEISYKFNKALMLKRSSRIRDKAEAEELLKEIVETETIFFDLIIKAHVHLCDILFTEYRIDNDNEILAELNHYIANLLTIAEKEHSYSVFCETFILKAKLALLNFDVRSARLFLTQAQKIAESYSMKRLAMKISFEHDELLKQLKLWEKLKESEAPLTERWKFAGVMDQMENIVKKRMIEVPPISEEEPVLLLVVSEGGTMLFSHSFITEKFIDSEIFSGFLTTIDYFIKELFSEGLDRAVFGEYTLLMKSIPPFFVSYIFRGDSYYANNKANFFIEQLKNKKEVWDILLKAFQINQYVHLKDNPSLELLIKEIFIEKTLY